MCHTPPLIRLQDGTTLGGFADIESLDTVHERLSLPMKDLHTKGKNLGWNGGSGKGCGPEGREAGLQFPCCHVGHRTDSMLGMKNTALKTPKELDWIPKYWNLSLWQENLL